MQVLKSWRMRLRRRFPRAVDHVCSSVALVSEIAVSRLWEEMPYLVRIGHLNWNRSWKIMNCIGSMPTDADG